MTAEPPVLLDPASFRLLYELPGAQTKLPEIIGLFLAEAESLLQQARAALETENLSRLERVAHGLRGSASLVGASRLHSDAERLELAAARGQLADLGTGLEQMAVTLQETRPLLLAALEHPPVA